LKEGFVFGNGKEDQRFEFLDGGCASTLHLLAQDFQFSCAGDYYRRGG